MSSMTRKCYKMIGFIFRATRAFVHPESILKLYYTYVRSRLEYSCSVRNPQYTKYVDLIETVQKKLTRLLYYRFHWIKPDYKTRLKQLHMHSPETRRLQMDEMLLYNIIKGRLQTSLSSNHVNHALQKIPRHFIYQRLQLTTSRMHPCTVSNITTTRFSRLSTLIMITTMRSNGR